MCDILNLAPTRVFFYFSELCKIPRASKKEAQVTDWVMTIGNSLGLSTQRDAAGNVLIKKPATLGKENITSVIFQSHIDMVCEKEEDLVFDFDKDPITPYIDGEWIKAKGTTLGADNGVGVAIQLALMEATDIEHGPLSFLFTVDEETGLIGATNLDPSFLDGKILLNLDSEDEGEFYIGCAGGIDTHGVMDPEWDTTIPKNHLAYSISVSGLKGGHSGAHIHTGRGNAVKLLVRILWNAYQDYDMRVASINAGSVSNSIARDGRAIVLIPSEKKVDFEHYIQSMNDTYRKEFFVTDSNVKVTFESTDLPKKIINEFDQVDLMNALYSCIHGVLYMAQDIPNFVETSSNLASIKTKEDQIFITTSQRSSVESKKKDAVGIITAALYSAGFEKVKSLDEYPGWTPNPNSEALRTLSQAYKNKFDKPYNIQAVHAGLECGLFYRKNPELDMVSFGPTIRGPHSPEERLKHETVQQVWDLTVEFLRILK